MPTFNNQQLLNEYKKIVSDAAPSPNLAEKQQNLLEALDQMVKLGHCYFVYDIPSQMITHRKGIYDFLGHKDDAFSMCDYLDALHPALKAMQGRYSTGFVKALGQGKIRLDVSSTYFQYSQSLQHRNGKYLFVRRTLIPFHYTEDNKMLTWLNLFTFINDYEIHPFRFQDCRIEATNPKITLRDKALYNKLVQPVIDEALTKEEKYKILEDTLRLSNQTKSIDDCIKILNFIVTRKNASITTVARTHFKNNTKMVANRNSHIVRTMHKKYQMSQLAEAKDVAEFFKGQGLLPL